MVGTSTRSARRRRGSSLVEFALVTFMLMLVIFAGIEFDRMVLVYTTVAEAARVGARYAIVHGCDRSGGSGADGASGATAFSQVQTVVQEYAATGALRTSRLTINVNYSAAQNFTNCSTTDTNGVGSTVQVTVSYPYDPFTVLPLSVNLYSTSTGIIAF